MIAVGLMSGTSADGIDAAVVEIRESKRGPRVRTLHARTTPYPPAFRERLLRCPDVDAKEVARLSVEIGDRLGRAAREAIRRARLSPKDVAFVASHGHTVAHLPRKEGGATLQVGDPARIAERTGVDTYADFRPRDVAAGGEGAPLVPFADRLLFFRPGRRTAAQNVGGIANVTALGPKAGDLVAFDTGPGMMAIDLAVARATRGAHRFDPVGMFATLGRPDERLVRSWLAHPYFAAKPPKSTGRETFGEPFVAKFLARRRSKYDWYDLIASLTLLTARSIADAYRRFVGRVDEVVVSGGGARNETLMILLARELPEARVTTSAAYGVDPDFKEAVAFALLGWAARKGVPNTVPEATGARHAVVAGGFWPGRPAGRKV